MNDDSSKAPKAIQEELNLIKRRLNDLQDNLAIKGHRISKDHLFLHLLEFMASDKSTAKIKMRKNGGCKTVFRTGDGLLINNKTIDIVLFSLFDSSVSIRTKEVENFSKYVTMVQDAAPNERSEEDPFLLPVKSMIEKLKQPEPTTEPNQTAASNTRNSNNADASHTVNFSRRSRRQTSTEGHTASENQRRSRSPLSRS